MTLARQNPTFDDSIHLLVPNLHLEGWALMEKYDHYLYLILALLPNLITAFSTSPTRDHFNLLFTSLIFPISPPLSAVDISSCFTEERKVEAWDGNFLCFPSLSLYPHLLDFKGNSILSSGVWTIPFSFLSDFVLSMLFLIFIFKYSYHNYI